MSAAAPDLLDRLAAYLVGKGVTTAGLLQCFGADRAAKARYVVSVLDHVNPVTFHREFGASRVEVRAQLGGGRAPSRHADIHD